MAIRRKTTPRPSSGSNRITAIGGGAAKQNTVWDWFAPGVPLNTVQTFDLTPYASSNTGPVTLQDVLGLLSTSSLGPCNFPVYPRVGLTGLFIRTNISEFTQYADAPPSQIPVSLAETIEVASDKGQYLGCDNGSANVSQSGVRIKTQPKITSIISLGENEVLVSLDIFNLAQNVFVGQSGLPFFPWNEDVFQQGVLVPINAYFNNGQIAANGIYARYLPGNKNTSLTSLSSTFDFSLT